MKTIVYQGVKGAFSYLTAVKKFGEENNFKGLQTFKELFDWVEEGRAAYAVIPIENSLIGSIYENYDLLNRYEMQIVAEQFTKIEHCLLAISSSHANAEDGLQTVTKVLSHPKALEQCSNFFQRYPWMEAVVYSDTAAAAAAIALGGDPTCAAIASAQAGELYGLKILKKGIEDDSKNYTRFLTIAKKELEGAAVDKCSLLLQLQSAPGSVAEMLTLFADKAIHVTKIESRPLRGYPFEYLFYVDFEFKQNVEPLLQDMRRRVQKLKILGFYKRGSYE